jgi:hypothetical protein
MDWLDETPAPETGTGISTVAEGVGEGSTPIPSGAVSGGEAGGLFQDFGTAVGKIGTTIQDLFGTFLKGSGGVTPRGANRYPSSYSTLFPGITTTTQAGTIGGLSPLILIGVVALVLFFLLKGR